MWRDTVTIYRNLPGKVERIVIDSCHFEQKMEQAKTVAGDGVSRTCRLWVRGDTCLRPGDRVVAGIGPEGTVPDGAVELAFVKPCLLQGRLHHTEAHNR